MTSNMPMREQPFKSIFERVVRRIEWLRINDPRNATELYHLLEEVAELNRHVNKGTDWRLVCKVFAEGFSTIPHVPEVH